MATSREPFLMGGAFFLTAVTVRRTRGRSAHLFIQFIDGAVGGGYPSTLCGTVAWKPHRWRDADPRQPLCNECRRAFHRERRLWRGAP